MSEEIKKIKDKLEIIIRNDFDYLLRTHDCKILLDYITNLQQKVEQLENIRKEIKEYIEKNVVCCKNSDILAELNVDDLLNILQGSDKE